MTREEAIDIIKCLAWHRRPDEEDIEQAIKVLEREPCNSGNPNKWIPVSEGLPKSSGEYFVSIIDGSGEDNDYEAVGVAWFAHKKDYDIKESEWRELGYDETVIAWMLKPRPYKAEKPETCKGCLEPCIMYEPDMRACKKR